MKVLLFFLNLLAFIGLLIFITVGFFYAVALFCVPFYATYRALTEKEPYTKRKYTTTAIASTITLFLIGLLSLMLSKGAQQERERAKEQTTYTISITRESYQPLSV